MITVFVLMYSCSSGRDGIDLVVSWHWTWTTPRLPDCIFLLAAAKYWIGLRHLSHPSVPMSAASSSCFNNKLTYPSHVLPGWRPSKVISLPWIWSCMKPENWLRIDLSGDWCLCIALHTCSGACYYWIDNLTDCTIQQPGFDLPRHTWSLLNHFRTCQGHCCADLPKLGLGQSLSCDCGQRQTMNYTVDMCPITKFEGGLKLLHEADDDAVVWLESTATTAFTKWWK